MDLLEPMVVNRRTPAPRSSIRLRQRLCRLSAPMLGATIVVLNALWFIAGCEEEPLPPPPPPASAPTAPEMDHKHSIRIKADRSITIPNAQLVIQRDPVGSDMTGFTLLSTRPGADATRLLFGTTQNMASLNKLTNTDIHFGGARYLDARGNGIFTPTAAYQPKLVTMKITQLTEGEAHGTITGEFYLFKTAAPALRPAVVQLNATFDAILILQ
jgi:hypothetical protein